MWICTQTATTITNPAQDVYLERLQRRFSRKGMGNCYFWWFVLTWNTKELLLICNINLLDGRLGTGLQHVVSRSGWASRTDFRWRKCWEGMRSAVYIILEGVVVELIRSHCLKPLLDASFWRWHCLVFTCYESRRGRQTTRGESDWYWLGSGMHSPIM